MSDLLGSAFPRKAFGSVPLFPMTMPMSASHKPVTGDALTSAERVGGWRSGQSRVEGSEKSDAVWRSGTSASLRARRATPHQQFFQLIANCVFSVHTSGLERGQACPERNPKS